MRTCAVAREEGSTNEAVHESAVARMQADLQPRYAPSNLVKFLESGGAVVGTTSS